MGENKSLSILLANQFYCITFLVAFIYFATKHFDVLTRCDTGLSFAHT